MATVDLSCSVRLEHRRDHGESSTGARPIDEIPDEDQLVGPNQGRFLRKWLSEFDREHGEDALTYPDPEMPGRTPVGAIVVSLGGKQRDHAEET